MNNVPDRRALTWAVIYALVTVVVMGGIYLGVAVYQQSASNGATAQRIEDISQRIEDCLDPQGSCGQQSARNRMDFAEVLDNQRHRDLAAIFVCVRQLPVPRADVPRLVRCIERKDNR